MGEGGRVGEGDLSQPRIIFQALYGKHPLACKWLLRFRRLIVINRRPQVHLLARQDVMSLKVTA